MAGMDLPFVPTSWLLPKGSRFAGFEESCPLVMKPVLGYGGKGIDFNPPLPYVNHGEDLLVQKMIPYRVYDDNVIVEVRIMCVQKGTERLLVPMARLGHYDQGIRKIHFKDNVKEGYGLTPVIASFA